ncbi:MAG: hypothetical protein PHT34_04635 [Oscillospiraceae bacterium]|nr:hypothetical protein [Oscillospiraceae bacterium]
MLRKTRLVICAAALLLALCTLCTAGVHQIKTSVPQNTAASALSAGQKTLTLSGREAAKALYVVKEYQGQICVFSPGENLPELTTGIPADTLRAGDRLLLKKGIQVDSQEALASLLEDYGY